MTCLDRRNERYSAHFPTGTLYQINRRCKLAYLKLLKFQPEARSESPPPAGVTLPYPLAWDSTHPFVDSRSAKEAQPVRETRRGRPMWAGLDRGLGQAVVKRMGSPTIRTSDLSTVPG